MMYLLQICHPNDLLTDGWNTVDEINVIDLSHIESPVFEWHSGLLVRIIDPISEDIPFEGICGQTHCINASYDSSFAEQSLLPPRKGMLKFWQTTIDPYLMMRTITPYIHEKVRLQAFIDRLSEVRRIVESEEQRRLASVCIKALYAWISGKVDIKTIDDMREQLEMEIEMSDSIPYRAIIAAMQMISNNRVSRVPDEHPSGTSVHYTASCLVYLNQTNFDDELANMANLLRSRIPFYDIAVAIGNS